MNDQYAMKYNMTSSVNDKYNRYKDVILICIGIYILYDKYNVMDYPIAILVIFTLIILCIIYWML